MCDLLIKSTKTLLKIAQKCNKNKLKKTFRNKKKFVEKNGINKYIEIKWLRLPRLKDILKFKLKCNSVW